MEPSRITVSLDRTLVEQVDQLVQSRVFASRREAIESAVTEKLSRLAEGADAKAGRRRLLESFGSWCGDDLPERLREVYETRSLAEP